MRPPQHLDEFLQEASRFKGPPKGKGCSVHMWMYDMCLCFSLPQGYPCKQHANDWRQPARMSYPKLLDLQLCVVHVSFMLPSQAFHGSWKSMPFPLFLAEMSSIVMRQGKHNVPLLTFPGCYFRLLEEQNRAISVGVISKIKQSCDWAMC